MAECRRVDREPTLFERGAGLMEVTSTTPGPVNENNMLDITHAPETIGRKRRMYAGSCVSRISGGGLTR